MHIIYIYIYIYKNNINIRYGIFLHICSYIKLLFLIIFLNFLINLLFKVNIIKTNNWIHVDFFLVDEIK